MTNDKPTYAKVMTPRGTLVYPNLNKPDFKFKKETGEWSARIRLNVEDSEALIAKIDAELEKYLPQAKAEIEDKIAKAKTPKDKAKLKAQLADLKEADKPYKPAYDDDGNETGEYEFNFKSPASFKSKDSTEDNPVMKPIKIDLFDAKGKPMTGKIPSIWGGSVAKVAGEMRGFCMPIGYGISLRLKAVQVIELNSGSGPKDAGSYGFGAEEGGFEAGDEDEDTGSGFSDESGTESKPAGGAGDDF